MARAVVWQVARQSLPIMILAIVACLVVRFANAYKPYSDPNVVLGICMALAAIMIGISTSTQMFVSSSFDS